MGKYISVAVVATLMAFVSTIGLGSLIENQPPKPPELNLDFSTLNKADLRQIDCLAENIYYEARGEGVDGMLAVAMVTLNRVEKGFAPTVCKVVHQKTTIANIDEQIKTIICQFSWVCDKLVGKKAETELYNLSKKIAKIVYLNYHTIEDITQGAVFFHTASVKPSWKGVVKTTRIGSHVFYRKRGEDNAGKTEFTTNERTPWSAIVLSLD